MRRDHEVHRVVRHAERIERGQVSRQRVASAGVDEGGAAIVTEHQVGGVELRAGKPVSMAKTLWPRSSTKAGNVMPTILGRRSTMEQ